VALELRRNGFPDTRALIGGYNALVAAQPA
jgi:hypothetical protein